MNTARKLKTDPAVLAGMIELLAKDPRYGHHKGILLETAGLIGSELIDPEPMTLAQVAAFIGKSPGYVRTLVETKKIPFRQACAGAALMFDKRDIRAWWHSIRKGC